MTGGAPCPLPGLEYFQGKGMPFQDSFGTTQIAGGSILDADHVKEKAGSIGRPYFHLQGRIVDESDRDVPTGEVGELVVRGPNVFAGYWGFSPRRRERVCFLLETWAAWTPRASSLWSTARRT